MIDHRRAICRHHSQDCRHCSLHLYVTAVDRADLPLASIHLSQHCDCLPVCFLFSLEILSDQKLLLIIKSLLRLSLSCLAGHMIFPPLAFFVLFFREPK